MYNPFDKKIDDLEFDDLRKLIEEEVKEGFYIEYKTDFQKNQKIAKSIASFANTHGGWYFIGVEDHEDTNIAKELVGFGIKKNKQPQEKIRDIAKEHIHPLPIFHMKLIKFKRDRGILVVFIPESFETPHVLSNGVIYRRNGEQSSPIRETDRYALDKLYQKSFNFKERVLKFCKDPFGITTGESEISLPFLKMYFVPKWFDDIHIDTFFSDEYLEEIKALINQEETLFESHKEVGTFSLTFENITRGTHSIIFRDISRNVGFSNFTIEFFNNGSTKIRIPISFTTGINPKYQTDLDDEYLNRIYDEIGDEIEFFKLVNIYDLFFTIRYAIQKYQKFFEKIETDSKILMAIELENIYRLIPFIQNEVYLDYLKKYHVPVCMYKSTRVPDVYKPEPWIVFDKFQGKDFIWILVTVLNGLGLSTIKIGEKTIMDGFGDYIIELSKKNKSP